MLAAALRDVSTSRGRFTASRHPDNRAVGGGDADSALALSQEALEHASAS
jgi:hypothetical protein